MLGAAASQQPWFEKDLVVSDAWVDCGTMMIDFYLDDAFKSPLDPAIFEDIRGPGALKNLQTIDYAHIGTYDIRYRAYYENYGGTIDIHSQPFQVEILPACPQPTSI